MGIEDFFEEWDEDDFEDDNSSLLKPPDRFRQRRNILKLFVNKLTCCTFGRGSGRA